MDAAVAVQAAILAALRAEIDDTPVLADPPNNQQLPYIEVAETSASSAPTKSSDDEAHIVNVHTWARGTVAAKVLAGRVRDVLHEQAATVEDHSAGKWICTYRSCSRDADGITGHGILRFRLDTEPA